MRNLGAVRVNMTSVAGRS